MRLFDTQYAHYAADLKPAGEFIATGVAPRDASLPAGEHGAMTAVCLALFNLDEALTRE